MGANDFGAQQISTQNFSVLLFFDSINQLYSRSWKDIRKDQLWASTSILGFLVIILVNYQKISLTKIIGSDSL